MVEWDHKARYGWSYDTYSYGKHVDRWADSAVRDALRECYPRLEVVEIESSLRAGSALFIELAERAALAVEVPPFDHAAVLRELNRLLTVVARR